MNLGFLEVHDALQLHRAESVSFGYWKQDDVAGLAEHEVHQIGRDSWWARYSDLYEAVVVIDANEVKFLNLVHLPAHCRVQPVATKDPPVLFQLVIEVKDAFFDVNL